MLVFFVHGVATQNSGYSKRLEALIKEDLSRRNLSLPIFYASFWGNTFKRTGQLWNWIHEDLKELKKEHPKVDVRDIFRYQEFRQDFISEFFGDILTYLNPDRGRDIRESIANQLQKFVDLHPREDHIHLVAHSLGSVILWDVLFSEKFAPDDPAFEIRAFLNLYESSNGKTLKSITTMGSPILFFNLMLDINPFKLWEFTAKYQQNPLRWVNIIHSSDIVAYPLKTSLDARLLPNLFFMDKYIWADANSLERGTRTMGQANAAMALGVADAHSYYWDSLGTAQLVSANLVGDYAEIESCLPQK